MGIMMHKVYSCNYKAHHTRCNFDATLLCATFSCNMLHATFYIFTQNDRCIYVCGCLWHYYSSITEEKMS